MVTKSPCSKIYQVFNQLGIQLSLGICWSSPLNFNRLDLSEQDCKLYVPLLVKTEIENNCYFQKYFTHSYKHTIFEANTVKKGKIGQLSMFVIIFLGFTLYFMLTYTFSTQIPSSLEATFGEAHALLWGL